MWLHLLALAATTYAYARGLKISPPGSTLAALSFTLCGFQALHAVHEPFYHSMPYLPLCLLMADCYVATGRVAWLAGLALAWGSRSAWDTSRSRCGLPRSCSCSVFGKYGLTGYRLSSTHRRISNQPASAATLAAGIRVLGRFFGLFVGLGWGAAIAFVQLRLTWELTGAAGFVRPPHLLANYGFPPAHLAQLTLPEIFVTQPSNVESAYWSRYGTTGGEASAYVGIIPWILASVGVISTVPRQRPGFVAVDRVRCTGSGNDAGMVARWVLSVPETARCRLVSGPGEIHTPGQFGPGTLGRPGIGPFDYPSAILEGTGSGYCKRHGSLCMVISLGGQGRFPCSSGRRNDYPAISRS